MPLQNEKERWLMQLMSIAHLSDAEKRALLDVPMIGREYPRGSDLVPEGVRASESCLILDGFACRYKVLLEGKRQILSFHPPGDIPDLQSLHLKTMDHSVGALTRTRAAFIAHADIAALIDRHPRLGSIFWRVTLIDAAIFREWMVGLGRQDATSRLARLLCEMAVRLKAVGLVSNHTFVLPLTQQDLGDAAGMSTVHVNRVLRDLRQAELVEMRASEVVVRDWRGLRGVAEFNPAYLHLQDPSFHELSITSDPLQAGPGSTGEGHYG